MRSVSRPISTANKYLRNKHEKITGSPSRATNHLVRAKGFLKMTVKSENEICKLKYKLHSQKSKTPKSKFTLKFSHQIQLKFSHPSSHQTFSSHQRDLSRETLTC